MNTLISLGISDTDILFRNNDFSKTLGNIIKNCNNLSYLNLSHNSIVENNALEIADYLIRAKNLIEVDFSYMTNITGKSFAKLIYNISFSQFLTYLKINNC